MGLVDRQVAEGWADFLRYAEDESKVRRTAPDVREALMRLVEEEGGYLRQRLMGEAETEAEGIRVTAYEEAREQGLRQGRKEAEAMLRKAQEEAGAITKAARQRAKALIQEAQSQADRILAPLHTAQEEAAKRMERDEREAALRLKTAYEEVDRIMRPMRDAEMLNAMREQADSDIRDFLALHDADVARWVEAAKRAIARDLTKARDELERAKRDAVRIRREAA